MTDIINRFNTNDLTNNESLFLGLLFGIIIFLWGYFNFKNFKRIKTNYINQKKELGLLVLYGAYSKSCIFISVFFIIMVLITFI